MFGRDVYRQLAKITKCERTKWMYFENMKRVWRKQREKENAAVDAAAR